MLKMIENIEKNEINQTISYLYIKNRQLRMTYHIDDEDSYGEESEYYNGNEVGDSDDFSQLFHLDYREKDLTETIRQQGYFLIGEKIDEIPDYIQDFFINYKIYIADFVLKEIKRTFGNKKLIYVKLNIETSQVERMKQTSLFIQKILQRITK